MVSSYVPASRSLSPSRPFALARLEALQRAGLGVLRYGLVLLLVVWGSFKFAAFEAEGIRPLIEHSPLLSWLYALFNVRTAAALIGVFEVTCGVLIATRRWWPRLSGAASLAASGMFVVTLSFLVTTPGALEPTSEIGGFLMKDIMLLGAAMLTAAEALLAGGPSLAHPSPVGSITHPTDDRRGQPA